MVKQGDIISLQLNPSQGHEQRGFRPCICLSNNIVYENSKIIIVAPIGNTKRNYPFYYELFGYNTTGKVLIDQMRAIDPNVRIVNHIEKINHTDLCSILKLASFIFKNNIYNTN